MKTTRLLSAVLLTLVSLCVVLSLSVVAVAGEPLVLTWSADGEDVVENGSLKRVKGDGIDLVWNDDGEFTIREIDEEIVVQTLFGVDAARFLYFQIDDNVVFDLENGRRVTVQFEYRKGPFGEADLQYDSWSTDKASAYKSAKPVKGGFPAEWDTYEVELTDARFGSRQNAKADFRILIWIGMFDDDFLLKNLTVTIY